MGCGSSTNPSAATLTKDESVNFIEGAPICDQVDLGGEDKNLPLDDVLMLGSKLCADLGACGFFYQQHAGGHEVLGFYKTAADMAGERVWHDHKRGFVASMSSEQAGPMQAIPIQPQHPEGPSVQHQSDALLSNVGASESSTPATEKPAAGAPAESAAVEEPAVEAPAESAAVEEPAVEAPAKAAAVEEPAVAEAPSARGFVTVTLKYEALLVDAVEYGIPGLCSGPRTAYYHHAADHIDTEQFSAAVSTAVAAIGNQRAVFVIRLCDVQGAAMALVLKEALKSVPCENVHLICVAPTADTPKAMRGGSTGPYQCMLTFGRCLEAAAGVGFSFVEASNWHGMGEAASSTVMAASSFGACCCYNHPHAAFVDGVMEPYLATWNKRVRVKSYVDQGVEENEFKKAKESFQQKFAENPVLKANPAVTGNPSVLKMVPDVCPGAAAEAYIVHDEASKGFAELVQTMSPNVKKLSIDELLGSDNQIGNRDTTLFFLVDWCAPYNQAMALSQVREQHSEKLLITIALNTDLKGEAISRSLNSSEFVTPYMYTHMHAAHCYDYASFTLLLRNGQEQAAAEMLSEYLLQPDANLRDWLMADLVPFPSKQFATMSKGGAVPDGAKPLAAACLGLDVDEVETVVTKHFSTPTVRPATGAGKFILQIGKEVVDILKGLGDCVESSTGDEPEYDCVAGKDARQRVAELLRGCEMIPLSNGSTVSGAEAEKAASETDGHVYGYLQYLECRDDWRQEEQEMEQEQDEAEFDSD